MYTGSSATVTCMWVKGIGCHASHQEVSRCEDLRNPLPASDEACKQGGPSSHEVQKRGIRDPHKKDRCPLNSGKSRIQANDGQI